MFLFTLCGSVVSVMLSYEAHATGPHGLVPKHSSELVLCPYLQTVHLSVCPGTRGGQSTTVLVYEFLGTKLRSG